MGRFWANGWKITKKIIYTFFSWTHLEVISVDGFSLLVAQTTGTPATVCLLEDSLILLPILGMKFPKNPNFGGVNRFFQANLVKYWESHIIEATASISTKFCITIETTKWSSRVVRIRAQQIQDGGGRHLKNHKNRDISATVWPMFTKRGTMMQYGVLNRHDRYFLNFINPRWLTAAEKSLNVDSITLTFTRCDGG